MYVLFFIHKQNPLLISEHLLRPTRALYMLVLCLSGDIYKLIYPHIMFCELLYHMTLRLIHLFLSLFFMSLFLPN